MMEDHKQILVALLLLDHDDGNLDEDKLLLCLLAHTPTDLETFARSLVDLKRPGA